MQPETEVDNAAFDYDACHAFYREARYMQAYELIKPFRKELVHWTNPNHLNIAGRLAKNLGGGRLGEYLLSRAYRYSNKSWKHTLFKGYGIFTYRGALHAMRFMDESFARLGKDSEDENSYAHALALYADTLSEARDFDSANDYMQRALDIVPDDLYTRTTRARIYVQQEEFDAGMQCIEEILNDVPHYRPAVEYKGFYLAKYRSVEDAIEYLEAVAPTMEYGGVYVSLAVYYEELFNYQKMQECLVRHLELSPMIGDKGIGWHHGRISDAHYFLGNIPESIEALKKADGDFYKQRLEKMESADDYSYKRIDVPYVRQEHMTCAPAVLASLANYWGLPIEQMEIVNEICYDGTPDYEERRWAEEHKFLVREFSITWDSMVQLIDKGVPFAFTTAFTQHSHLQAVIGYSKVRGTIFVREPSSAIYLEYDFESIQKDQAPFGGRGMAIVPIDKADLIADLSLPDEEHYGHLYDIRRALSKHDRPKAAGALEQLSNFDADHLLTHLGRWSLCSYDGQSAEVLEILDILTKRFPECQRYLLSRFNYQKEIVEPEIIQEQILELIEKTKQSPFLLREYARVLVNIPKQQAVARQLLLQASRSLGMDADCLMLLSRMYVNRGQRSSAAKYLRLSACVEDKNEWYNYNYYSESRASNTWREALEHLRKRYEKLKHKSAEPGITLHRAYVDMSAYGKADELLDEMMQLHPDDGGLLIHACRDKLYETDGTWSHELLDKIKDSVRSLEYLRIKASVLYRLGDFQGTIDTYRAYLEKDPHDSGAHSMLVNVINEQNGPQQAIAYIDEIADKFPYSRNIQELASDWYFRYDLQKNLEHLDVYVKVDPKNIWARRQIVWSYIELNDLEKAQVALKEVLEHDDNSLGSLSLQGEIASRTGDSSRAFRLWLRALSLDPSSRWLSERLFDLCQSHKQQTMLVEELQKLIVRRGDAGNLVNVWIQELRACNDPASIKLRLKDVYAKRDDLWEVHVALARHHLEMDELEESEKVFKAAIERFPGLPRLQLELAELKEAMGKPIERLEALEAANEMAPAWTIGHLRLAGFYVDTEDYAKAQEIMENSLRANPRDSDIIGYLGKIYELQDKREQAIEQYEAALEIHSTCDWTWPQLRNLDSKSAEKVAKSLIEKRPGDSELYFMLARSQFEHGNEEALTSLDRAIAIHPTNVTYIDFKAWLLADYGDIDAALKLCDETIINGHTPIALQRRRGALLMATEQLNLAEITFLEVVKEEPHDYVAWRNLSDLYVRLEKYDKCIEVANKMAALFPRSSEAMVHVADAYRLLGQNEDAKEYFKRALRLEKNYPFASFNLFDMAYDENDEETMAFAIDYIGVSEGDYRAWGCAREIKYALRTNNTEVFSDTVYELVRLEQTTWDVMEDVYDTCMKAKMHSGFIKLCRDAVSSGESDDNVENWFGEKGLQIDSYDDMRVLLKTRTENLKFFLGGALIQISNKNNDELIKRLVKDYEDELCQSCFTWGKTLYALLNTGFLKKVRDVGGKWRDVPDLMEWPFVNIIISLLRLKKFDEASELILEASDVVDFSSGTSTSFYVFSRILSGNRRDVEELMHNMTDTDDDGFSVMVAKCVKLLNQNNADKVRRGVARLCWKYNEYCSEYEYEEFRQILLKTLSTLVERHGGLGLRFRLWRLKIRCAFGRMKLM